MAESFMHEMALGAIEPPDQNHIEKYPANVVGITSVGTVEKIIKLPAFRPKMNQNPAGACVGWTVSWLQSINNRHFYDGWWAWYRAREIDGFAFNDNLKEHWHGTSLRAGFDVLRTLGHKRHIYRDAVLTPGDTTELKVVGGDKGIHEHAGISANRWLSGVDEARDAISKGLPIAVGSTWFSEFDIPRGSANNYWWPKANDNWGRVRGGHAYTLFGASDKRQAFRMVNTWGNFYPVPWVPYEVIERLQREHYFEMAVVTDR
jgi:hypothetical protein